ncbi:16S rRNA methyltransferase [Porphyromonas crevioricanis]|uniref:Ribosomal RNA small subunit methyltransferase H n=2 Tax=Porphyromonas crevioricanis TaxID=393921 RepID=A0A0A2G4K0_9PORP|nr:16S rRNA (cytosine(1402)-N(4))-methyltransferase RsmH [Porphyromonas crevioricanis]KGN90285.1 16S rRNA methyltransferase [Porphyromonas crevioricanis]KGN95374.1 16S rRNA methyltransferase [Porphyromonas crevioricanis]SKA04267.1 16S rRNA (cytosine1402-N4)-methyltransferase [Porphyromonas crevioricanis]SQH72724.1 Ribosomal RNA small subunit methyltransferase H [Porphyromonas crevioricanis]GAD04840.1 rRNA small subunit methyltransferase H [Porphyromonas crevioricanis JCM 15906]
MYDTDYHSPVLLRESLDALVLNPEGIYVDVTYGGGGHSKGILSRLSNAGRVLGFDQDPDARANASEDPRFTFVASNFRYLYHFVDYYGLVGQIDGILADLGVSSHQFDTAERGFSFRTEESTPDMRMNSRSGMSASTLLQSYDEEHLANIFYRYGELRNARQIARRIVTARQSGETFGSIASLKHVIEQEIDPRKEKKQWACIFQALRIEVNDELSALEEMLRAAVRVLKPGGRLAVITYHSLEDRIVKNFFRSSNQTDKLSEMIYGHTNAIWEPITRKPIVPGMAEQESNPRSRSAGLRVAAKR